MKAFILFSLLLSLTAHALEDQDEFSTPDFFKFSGMSQQEFSGSDSSLSTACKKDGYSCGECETPLQDDLNQLMNRITKGGFTQKQHWGDGRESSKNSDNIAIDPNVKLEDTLQEIVNLFKKHNPVGENRLNFVVIGESESLQASSIRDGKIHPRIMLKSPNSELMVTFNTDPKSKGYKTIEMMRWNGRLGRYEFQELNFGEGGEKPHVDASGTKCLECHKSPSPRPNWDTYRAWAGVVPSRDDMMEMHATDGQFDMKKGMQPDARAYINFLEQVAEDKDGGKKTRLSMLDIPFDEKRQLSQYVAAAGKTNLTSREKIDIIKKKIADTGFYRIRHFPDKEEGAEKGGMSFNFDNKTAPWAGPSQFAFDQMLAQNMCKITTDLKKHPDFDKFKYALALMMKCGRVNSMESVYPEEFKDQVLDYYQASKYQGLGDIEAARKPAGRSPSFSDLAQLVYDDTEKGHDHANGFKYNRHERFLTSYLTSVERMGRGKAQEKAKYYSEQVVTPTQNNFHAIDDAGGVKGVAEGSTSTLASVRMLLEPFGIPVSHWSLVHGKNSAYNSFSFSDQFVLFEGQELFDDILEEAGSCSELESKARSALASATSKQPKMNDESTQFAELAAFCGPEAVPSALGDKMNDIHKVVQAQMKTEMKSSMSKCLNCHDTDGVVEFPGLREFAKPPRGVSEQESEKKFVEFLNSYNEAFKRPMVEVLAVKLGLLPRPQGQEDDYGSDMPPTAWKDNADFAQKHGLDPASAQDSRRHQLAFFLMLTAKPSATENVANICNKVNDSRIQKEVNVNTTGQNNARASEQ